MTEAENNFINELTNEIHPDIGHWAGHLIKERGMSIKEVKEAMQRMIDIAMACRDNGFTIS